MEPESGWLTLGETEVQKRAPETEKREKEERWQHGGISAEGFGQCSNKGRMKH